MTKLKISAALPAGNREAPRAGWGGLTDDVQQLILGKLSLRERVRFAAIGRELWEPYVAWREQERASFLAAAEESYGENLLSNMLEVGKRAMCGLPARIASLVKRRERRPVGPLIVFISDWQPPTYRPPASALKNGPNGLVSTGSYHFPDLMLHASVLHWSGTGRYCTQTELDIFKLATGDVRVKVKVTEEGVRPAVGLLLAMCLQNPKPTSSAPRHLVVEFHVQGPSAFASAVKEGENLLEVLRALLSPTWSKTTSTVVT